MQQIWFDAAVVSQSLGCRQDVFVALLSLLNMLVLAQLKRSACARNLKFKGLMYFLCKCYREY